MLLFRFSYNSYRSLSCCQVFGWPTKSGLSQAIVEAICRVFITSSDAAQTCKGVPGVDDQAAMENCVEDIQVSLSESFK